MSSESKQRRLSARTKDELFTHINSFLDSNGLTLRQLSAYALGSSETLPRIQRDGGAGLRLDTVDRVLSYIETH